jgi:hypothetical protein
MHAVAAPRPFEHLWLAVDDPGLRNLIGVPVGLHDIRQTFELFAIWKRFQHLKHVLTGSIIPCADEQVFLGGGETRSLEVIDDVHR